MTRTAEIAELIEVHRRGDEYMLRVDGQPFPWHVADPVEVGVSNHDAPHVRLTLIAERVEVVNDLSAPATGGSTSATGGDQDGRP